MKHGDENNNLSNSSRHRRNCDDRFSVVVGYASDGSKIYNEVSKWRLMGRILRNKPIYGINRVGMIDLDKLCVVRFTAGGSKNDVEYYDYLDTGRVRSCLLYTSPSPRDRS